MDGGKIFIDSSLVEADASNNSVIDTQSLKHQLKKNYRELEARLEERQRSDGREESDDDSGFGGGGGEGRPARSGRYSKVNDRYISSTDPDAAIVGRGKPDLFYQVHRSVDEAHEIITATAVTPGDVSEGQML